jgi:anti-sigma28 factor (negative regulator of flagellin synthesis)
MRVWGAPENPYLTRARPLEGPKPQLTTPAKDEQVGSSPRAYADVAVLSPAASERLPAIDQQKVEQLKQRVAQGELSPNASEIAAKIAEEL